MNYSLKIKERTKNFKCSLFAILKRAFKYIKFRDKARPVFSKDWPFYSRKLKIIHPAYNKFNVKAKLKKDPTKKVKPIDRWEAEGGLVKDANHSTLK